ncbi:sigma-70 family RNA polymerase sigma factor [Planctomycetota bacterium]
MNSINTSFDELLKRACAGEDEAIGELIDLHRPYLRILALRGLDSRVAVRVSASDIVQQTCLSLVQKIGQFNGGNKAEFVAWLRTIHENNIRNAIRHVSAKKRAVRREDPEGPDRLDAQPDLGGDISPSARLMLGEDFLRLATALQELPEDQHEAVRLRFIEGWSLARIAERMDRTFDSVAGLVKRGLINLRNRLDETQNH